MVAEAESIAAGLDMERAQIIRLAIMNGLPIVKSTVQPISRRKVP